jgi:hypothetical protein
MSELQHTYELKFAESWINAISAGGCLEAGIIKAPLTAHG